ncbi:hypothetical protein [Roseobacter sp. GAI101]|uniref:hypothetical protein n=1 Tax=Roseobacter sp. (strain GAI101) TaxID=391589 RepID=UPI0005648EB2|nr:hypothetical protein [Roseobacter sp. GAI101]
MNDELENKKHPFGLLELEGARLILSGFRRDTYAGVLRLIDRPAEDKYICDLLLDGFGRKVQVNISGLSCGSNRQAGKSRIAAIYGLPFLLTPPKAELTALDYTGGIAQQFAASFDLHAAVFHINVLSYVRPTGGQDWVCVLDISRAEGC